MRMLTCLDTMTLEKLVSMTLTNLLPLVILVLGLEELEVNQKLLELDLDTSIKFL